MLDGGVLLPSKLLLAAGGAGGRGKHRRRQQWLRLLDGGVLLRAMPVRLCAAAGAAGGIKQGPSGPCCRRAPTCWATAKRMCTPSDWHGVYVAMQVENARNGAVLAASTVWRHLTSFVEPRPHQQRQRLQPTSRSGCIKLISMQQAMQRSALGHTPAASRLRACCRAASGSSNAVRPAAAQRATGCSLQRQQQWMAAAAAVPHRRCCKRRVVASAAGSGSSDEASTSLMLRHA